MSTGFGTDVDYSIDNEELLHIETTCQELRKEKDLMREALSREQSKNAELIRQLESDVKALTDAHLKDKKYIEDLERELRNCSQQIGYLQDELNLRNAEANCLGEHVQSLELKLVEIGKLNDKVSNLTEELARSDAKCASFMRTLERKEVEVQKSMLHIEKLEAEISTIVLESQCEIESMKLDQIALEERHLEAKKFGEQAAQDKVRMGLLIEELEAQFEAAQQTVNCSQENKQFQEKLVMLDRNHKILNKPMEWKRNNVVTASDDDKLKDEMEKVLHENHEYKLKIKKLEGELRETKLRAKEEAEDLAQEMAELRYQTKGLLEQECQRRASIEQASLQRISKLEAQVREEQRKYFTALRHLREAQKLAEERSMKANHSNNSLVGLSLCGNDSSLHVTEVCSCGECVISKNTSDCLDEVLVGAEAREEICTSAVRPLAIAWHSE